MQTPLTLPVAKLGWKTTTKFAAGKHEGRIFPLSPYHPCSCPVPPWAVMIPAGCWPHCWEPPSPAKWARKMGPRSCAWSLSSNHQWSSAAFYPVTPGVLLLFHACATQCLQSEHEQDQHRSRGARGWLGLSVQSWGRILSHSRCSAAFSKVKHSSWI